MGNKFFFIIIVKHDSYYSGSGAQVLLLMTLSSIDFNCIKSHSICSDELLDHQNS